MFLNPFLVSIEEKFHSALIYDNKDLQKRSLDVIPVIKLEIAAQKRLRSFQGRMKNGMIYFFFCYEIKVLHFF